MRHGSAVADSDHFRYTVCGEHYLLAIATDWSPFGYLALYLGFSMAIFRQEDYEGLGCISCGLQPLICGFAEVVQMRLEEKELIFDLSRHVLAEGVLPFECACGGEARLHGVLPLAEPWEQMNRCQMCAEVIRWCWVSGNPLCLRKVAFARHAQTRFVVPTDDMEFIPYGSSARSPVLYAEIFCGGFSGWTRAATFLASRAYPGRVVFALDKDREVFNVHCMNFACREIEESGFAMNEIGNKIGCCACISRFEPAAGLQGVTAWLCSPPCPAFSKGGSDGGKGWSHPDALPFKCLFGKMRLSRPWIVCLENVPPLKTDALFYNELAAWCEWSGYHIHWDAVTSLGGYSTVDRCRFLAVLQRKEGPLLDKAAFQIPHRVKQGMAGDRVWCTLPRDLVAQHTLDPETKAMYFCREYLPADVRNSPEMLMERYIARYRTLTPEDRVPGGTVMASYGNQHCLSERALKQKGIFGKLVKISPDAEDLRWLSAGEIALALGITTPCWFPNNARLALHVLGNSMAEQHAILTLQVLLKSMGTWPKWIPLHQTWSEVDWSDGILTNLAGNRLAHLQVFENTHCSLHRGDTGPVLQVWTCNCMTEHLVVFEGDELQSDVSVHSSCPANQDMQYETDCESVSDDGNHRSGSLKVQVMNGNAEFANFNFPAPISSFRFAWHFNEFLRQMNVSFRIASHGFVPSEESVFAAL